MAPSAQSKGGLGKKDSMLFTEVRLLQAFPPKILGFDVEAGI